MDISAFKKLNEYALHSPHKGTMRKPTIRVRGENILCGDSLAFDFAVKNAKITDAKFRHTGCALSAAAAAELAARARGKTYAALKKLAPDSFLASLGIPVSPARVPCALLPLAILQMPPRHARKRPQPKKA